jgi:hypothetical protein
MCQVAFMAVTGGGPETGKMSGLPSGHWAADMPWSRLVRESITLQIPDLMPGALSQTLNICPLCSKSGGTFWAGQNTRTSALLTTFHY